MALRAAEMAAGLAYVSAPIRRMRRWRSSGIEAPVDIRAALVVHLYYPDVLEEALAALDHLPPGSPLLVTAPPAQAKEIERLVGDDPRVEIHVLDNRGRDVAPFLALLSQGALERFDAVLKLHSKRSPHLRLGDLRRRIFFSGLAGSRGEVARTLNLFRDPRVGFVGLAPYFRTRPLYWMANRGRVEQLCAQMRVPARLGFFEGSMLWIRPQALEPLRALGLSTQSFEAEAGQLDGTLHHAIERCFTLAGQAKGYEVRSLGGGRLRPR